MSNETKLPGKVVRGGMVVNCHKDSYRSHHRSWDFPTDRGDLLGFRCVYPVNTKPKPKHHFLWGGAWYNLDAENFRSHHHYRCNTFNGYSDQGFRCVYSSGNPND